MKKTEASEGIEELALMLMYLSRMKETIPETGKYLYYAWKGYEWETMNELEKDGLISQSRKMVTFTEEGEEKAKELLAKYGIEDWPTIPSDN